MKDNEEPYTFLYIQILNKINYKKSQLKKRVLDEHLDSFCNEVDAYGRINYDQEKVMKMKKELLEIKICLKDYAKEKDSLKRTTNVKKSISDCFDLIRYEIQNCDIKVFFEDWPILTIEEFFLHHVKDLFGDKDFKSIWNRNLFKIKNKAYKFFNLFSINNSTQARCKQIKKFVQDAEYFSEVNGSDVSKSIALFPIIIAYFKDKLENMIVVHNVSILFLDKYFDKDTNS